MEFITFLSSIPTIISLLFSNPLKDKLQEPIRRVLLCFVVYYDEFSVEDGGSFYVVEFNLYLKALGIYQKYILECIFSYNNYSSSNFSDNSSDNCFEFL